MKASAPTTPTIAGSCARLRLSVPETRYVRGGNVPGTLSAAPSPTTGGFTRADETAGVELGAPYCGDVAITASFFAAPALTPLNAFAAFADRAPLVDGACPSGTSPWAVGTISTYWETEDAGPSPADAPAGAAITTSTTRAVNSA
jgi:hypothetical protein